MEKADSRGPPTQNSSSRLRTPAARAWTIPMPEIGARARHYAHAGERTHRRAGCGLRGGLRARRGRGASAGLPDGCRLRGQLRPASREQRRSNYSTRQLLRAGGLLPGQPRAGAGISGRRLDVVQRGCDDGRGHRPVCDAGRRQPTAPREGLLRIRLARRSDECPPPDRHQQVDRQQRGLQPPHGILRVVRRGLELAAARSHSRYEGWTDNSDPVGAFDPWGNFYAVVFPYQFSYIPSGQHFFLSPDVNPSLARSGLGIAVRPHGAPTATAWNTTRGGQLDLIERTPFEGKQIFDKQWLTIDANRHSPHFGRVYVTWAAGNQDSDLRIYGAYADAHK